MSTIDARRSLDDVKAIPILDVAAALAIRVRGTSARCPFVGHEDRNPSFSLYPDENRCWCHGCSKGGSPIDLVVHTHGGSVGEAVAWLRSQFGLSPNARSIWRPRSSTTTLGGLPPDRKTACKPNSEIYSALLEQCPLSAAATAYLMSRRFTAKTIQHFRLGTFTDNRATTQVLTERFGRIALIEAGLMSRTATNLCFIAPAVLFPFYVRGELTYIQARALSGSPAARWLGLRGVIKPVFNFDVIAKARSVYICEGATDVLSMHQMGLAAIGLLGGTTALPNDVVLSLKGKETYIVPDRDDVGETMVQRLKAQLQRAGLSVTTKRLDVGRDVNERLMMRGPR